MTAHPAPLTVLDYTAMGIGYGVMFAAALLAAAVLWHRAVRRANRRRG